MSNSTFRQFDIDQYFYRRLKCTIGVNIFTGLTDFDSRRAAIREAILTHQLGNLVINSRGEPETWAVAFERLYREPLRKVCAA